MRLSNRMTEIIKALYSIGDFATSESLASELGVTSRTIREDIKAINSIMFPHDVQIISQKGKGYVLTSSSEEKLDMVLGEIETKNVSINSQTVTPEDRVRYIIKTLLFANKCIKLQSLMDELYVSDSTLKGDLKRAKKVLGKYNIKVVKSNEGISVQGNEANVRFCISDFFIHENELTNDFVIHLINNFGYSFTDEDIKQIHEIILRELSSHDIIITDDVLNTITIHILIAISRIKTGQPINTITRINELKNVSEFEIAKRINRAIEDRYNIQFSEEEIAYTTLHLVGNRLGLENLQDMKAYIGDEILQLSMNIMEQTTYVLKGINLQDDKELMYSLGLHLKQLTTRLKYEMNIRNPLVEKIKIKYPLAFEVGVVAAHSVEKQTGFKVNDHEIGFLALHFGAAIERQQIKNTAKKKVALVCASGMATSSLLLSKLSHVLDHSYTLIGAYPLHQLDELLEQGPDYILTTIQIDKNINVPIISVPAILNGEDVTHIRNTLDNMHSAHKTMTQFFKEDLFFPSLKTTTKEATLNYLTSALLEAGYIDQNMERLIIERERISPTSIGNSVAIPHPLNMESDQSFMCVAILNQSVKWSMNNNVQLVIIIVLENKWQSKFEDIFGALYEIVHSREQVKQLCEARNITEFLDIIETF